MWRNPGRVATAGAVLFASVLAGCGDEGGDYANKPRPATPINVTAAISPKKISISPKEFGAGPVVIIVSNQTGAKQRVTLQTEELGGNQPGLKQSTDPIAPRGTGTLKADIREGSYALSTSDGPKAVTLEVGPKRKSAQDQLLQP
ncbi:MAG TPA: hypothetical protein VKB28_11145 [Solirubrobacteraceae bacterium]|nr:hypothetical protein [Solirubrobacteraceae bacterium]